MSGTSANSRKIDDAFKKAATSVRSQSLRAVTAGVRAGYNYSLDLHSRAKHELHLKLGGDFGYGVAQDRQTKVTEVVAGEFSAKRTAERQIAAHLAGGPAHGVLGVMSAGMDSAKFDDNWEEKAVFPNAFAHAKEAAMKEFDNEG